MKRRVVAKPGEDLLQVVGVEHLGAQLAVLVGKAIDLLQADLVDLLGAVKWGPVRSVQFQEGAGISKCFMGAMVSAVCPEWLRATLDPLYQLLLIC